MSRPPVARRRPVSTHHHGRPRTDAYDWLRRIDDPELGPEVRAYLEAENVYHSERTAHLAGLQEEIFEEIRARTQESDLSVPVRHHGFWWYSRTFEGREHGAWCRAPVVDPDDWVPPRPRQGASPSCPGLPGEEVLLDLEELAAGHDYFALGSSWLSLDGRFLAYSTDTTGDERYDLRIRDVLTGELLDDELTNVFGTASWATDGSLYYTTLNESWRVDKVWRHRVGTAQTDDELVHAEEDDRFWVGVDRTRSDRFLVVVSTSKTASECSFLDLHDPQAQWSVLAERRDSLEYYLEHARIAGADVFLVLHNSTGPNFELATAPCSSTPPERWRPLVPHDPSVRLHDVEAFSGHLVLQQRSSGLTQVRVLELTADGIGADDLLELGDEVYTIDPGPHLDFAQPTVRVGYTSLARPLAIFDFDVRSRELTLLRSEAVLADASGSAFRPEDYEERRLWATAPDGEQVPISLVVRRDARARGGPVPLYLYAYGAYESSLDPWFSIERLSLLDRGAAFAIAHVRGGGEMGRRWYDDGRLALKEHTFTDFIACAEHLVGSGWTRRDVLVAGGTSAGGLLVGAVANRAPSTFGGLVAQVPFVDILTSMLDPTLPLTVTEYDEWGNPLADADTYDLIASYAPYDNVAAIDYPPILAETSLHDTRVLYVEPAKWIARLRATAVGRRDFVLRTEMAAGHGGVSGRYHGWRDQARTLAWILDRMGLARTQRLSQGLGSPGESEPPVGIEPTTSS